MSRSKTDEALQKYSKADLIWIIKAMQAHMRWPDLDYILADLEYKKEQSRLNQAQKLSSKAYDLTLEYNALIAPFEGKSWGDIPDAVNTQALALLKQINRTDQELRKLMELNDPTEG
nr:MAG TPA: hypothetical protein [Caudoviricetes sp.]